MKEKVLSKKKNGMLMLFVIILAAVEVQTKVETLTSLNK